MIKEWIRARIPEFYALPEAEKKAIADFGLLWPLFEGRILGAKGNVAGICQAVDRWDEAGTLRMDTYADELAYFRRLYLAKGASSDLVSHLHFKKGDREDLVRAVLGDPDSSAADQAKACLIITYRYRNNLFHGPRWQSDLRGQLETFNIANAILMKTLDAHGRLAD